MFSVGNVLVFVFLVLLLEDLVGMGYCFVK